MYYFHSLFPHHLYATTAILFVPFDDLSLFPFAPSYSSLPSSSRSARAPTCQRRDAALRHRLRIKILLTAESEFHFKVEFNYIRACLPTASTLFLISRDRPSSSLSVCSFRSSRSFFLQVLSLFSSPPSPLYRASSPPCFSISFDHTFPLVGIPSRLPLYPSVPVLFADAHRTRGLRS